MRGARYVRLFPWTLRSGSEQEQLQFKISNGLEVANYLPVTEVK